jgi:hypothetical protein
VELYKIYVTVYLGQLLRCDCMLRFTWDNKADFNRRFRNDSRHKNFLNPANPQCVLLLLLLLTIIKYIYIRENIYIYL